MKMIANKNLPAVSVIILKVPDHLNQRKILSLALLFLKSLIILPPTIADNPNNEEWCEHQIQYALIQSLGGLFTHLHGCFTTNRTLSSNR